MLFFDEIDYGIKTDDTNKQLWEWNWVISQVTETFKMSEYCEWFHEYKYEDLHKVGKFYKIQHKIHAKTNTKVKHLIVKKLNFNYISHWKVWVLYFQFFKLFY